MRLTFCHSCLAFLLKFLNYLQTFVGLSIVLYSAWMLVELNRHQLDDVSTPWFIYTVMAVGILLCLIAFTGYIAAGITSGCCLRFYAVITSVLIVVEAALVADLIFNKHWEEDFPHDATGELKSLRAFIEANAGFFKWVAVAVVVIQGLSLLLAIILRSMASLRSVDYQSDEDLPFLRKPLLTPQGSSASATPSIDIKEIRTDSWSLKMRQKYGMAPCPLSNSGMDTKASNSYEGRRRCSIL